MNKKRFLRRLESKLDLLKDEEKRDIIDEYAGHIDLKVEKGKTEEESVKDFGDIDELVDEILDAYKIKKNRKEGKNKFEEYVDEFVVTAKDVFKNLGESINQDTLGFIFKIVIVLIVIGVLKIPFYIVEQIGSGIFRTLTFGFMDGFIIWVWRVLVQIGYVLAAVLLAFAVLKKDGKLSGISNEIKKEINKATDKNKKKNTEKEKTSKESKKEDVISEKSVNKANHYITGSIMILVKVMAVLFCIPFVFTQVGLAISLGIFIKLAIEGVALWGIMAIIVGTMSIINVIASLIYNAAFNPKKLGIWMVIQIIIAFLFIGFGSVATVYDVMNYDYIDEMPNHSYEFTVEEYEYDVSDEITFRYDYGNVKVIEDESYVDTIKIKVTYIDNLIDIRDVKSGDVIRFDMHDEDHYFSEVKDLYNIFIEDVKDGKIYNYSELFKPKYEIYVNAENSSNIIIERR